MKAIAHPFFHTLYIDPVEGLYWDGHSQIGNKNIAIALYIPNPAKVSSAAIEFAASAVYDIAHLDGLARQYLEHDLHMLESGACAQYWHKYLAPHAGTALQHTLASAPALLEKANFVCHLHLQLVALFPVDLESPIIVEYTLGQHFSPATLNVFFSPQGEPISCAIAKE